MSKKYASSDKYTGLQKIATQLSTEGKQMNHSTVRNHLLRGFAKIAKAVLEYYDYQGDIDARAKEIAKSPDFHEYMYDMMHQIENEKKLKNKSTT
jgi:hypothetical protein